jgi:hypothetical protein
LWAAREAGADLVAVDVFPVAAFGLQGTADSAVGDFVATGLPTASCDGAVSLDVPQFVPDTAAALRDAECAAKTYDPTQGARTFRAIVARRP